MDPEAGAFLGTDPFQGMLTDPATLQRYSYAEANPVMLSDPTGYSTLLQVMTSVAIAGSLTTVSNALITLQCGRAIAADADQIPDAAIMTLSVSGSARGAIAEAGIDVIFDFRTRETYLYDFVAAGLSPIGKF